MKGYFGDGTERGRKEMGLRMFSRDEVGSGGGGVWMGDLGTPNLTSNFHYLTED